MPILAAFLGSIAEAIIAFGWKIFDLASVERWARVALYVTFLLAFAVAVKIGIDSLLQFVSASGLPVRVLQGIGMFIPSNAVAVITTMATVWIACVIIAAKRTAML